MSVLIGDVNGNALVNATDVSAAKLQSGVPVSKANFHADVLETAPSTLRTFQM